MKGQENMASPAQSQIGKIWGMTKDMFFKSRHYG